MAKKVKSETVKEESLPSDVDELLPPEELAAPPAAVTQKRRAAPPVTITLDLPTGVSDPKANRPTHVDLQLDRNQGEALRHLFDGLSGATLASGRRVAYMADAVRYLLDQLHAAYVEADAL